MASPLSGRGGISRVPTFIAQHILEQKMASLDAIPPKWDLFVLGALAVPLRDFIASNYLD